MALTDTAIRNLKPQPKPYKKSDSEGLQLHVMPQGSKLWRLAYRFAGKPKTIALGSYPVVTLAMAREFKAEARRLLAQGVDPSEKRKADKRAAAAARTFGEVADEWFETKRESEAKSEATLKRNRWLKGECKSEIGHRPIGEIEPPELLPALKKVAAASIMRPLRGCAPSPRKCSASGSRAATASATWQPILRTPSRRQRANRAPV